MRIALVIDTPPDAQYHRATVDAIGHAADRLNLPVDVTIHATDSLPRDGVVDGADGVVIGPGSPYRDEGAVWSVIAGARERGVPLVGT